MTNEDRDSLIKGLMKLRKEYAKTNDETKRSTTVDCCDFLLEVLKGSI